MVPKGQSDSLAPSTPPTLLLSSRCRRHSNGDQPGSSMTLHREPQGEKKRQLFWRNVVKQFNFTDQSERGLLLSLTGGICWMHMRVLPRDFMRRHREVYYLISAPEYERSGAIGRDVTRTFSIFERSAQHQLAAQQSALFRVLNAIAEAEDGYCQGMNFIAALFLVEGLSEADAYALFLYVLKKRHLAGIYHRSSTFLDEYLQHFEQLFIRDLPKLHAHLLAQGFAIPMYGIEWFTTLFSLSTKTELACAIFDLFFVGVQDIFLRAGLAILKLLEAKLMCMTFEDFLREFKPLVRELDPYQVILQALALRPNPKMHREDTTAHVSREHFLRSVGGVAPSYSDTGSPSSDSSSADGDEESASSLGGFGLHRTLPPDMAEAIRSGNGSLVRHLWEAHVIRRHYSATASIVLANEILHFAIWYGRVSVACLAIDLCNADVDNRDDAGLTPLHFSVIRNQPDMVRLLLAHAARMQETSMRSCDESADSNNDEEVAHDLFSLSYGRSRGSSTSTATTLSTSTRVGGSSTLSRSVSESSSLEFLNSPAAMSWLGSPRFFDDSFPRTIDTVQPNQDSETLKSPESMKISIRQTWQVAARPMLEFPDRPEWYCNARDCHFVFALFSQAATCSRCEGYFCSEHVDSKTKHCFECRRDLVCSPRSHAAGTAMAQS
ncbi:unnamed protein product [Phytophthora fragariaefolia]|uniref:Unnamed protein product n=1 Tax=Phytophthora fragariaefolia TaxID=1490495 RepID=A0A9W6X1H1_9STRA|nr:unnamed protein product [Phytophthora fragariaefolia]